MNAPLILFFALAITALPARAGVSLPAVISDHMVLQADSAVTIWGWSDADEAVTVSFAGQSTSTKANADGKWSVKAAAAKAPPAAKPKPEPVYASRLALEIEPTRRVIYKKVGDRELNLDVFEPDDLKKSDKRPCFVSIHGGGWTSGSPRSMCAFADHCAKQGMVAISVQYRLYKAGTEVTVFECVKDVRAAVRFIRAHAAELGIDPQKIVVNGSSAGGHLAVATELFDGVDHADEDLSVSCRPNALVLFSPVIDTSTQGYGNAKVGERWRDLSPAHQVRPGMPPTLLLHGTGDATTPFKGAQLFGSEMRKAGNRIELIAPVGSQHTYMFKDPAMYAETLKQLDAFFASLGFVQADKFEPKKRIVTASRINVGANGFESLFDGKSFAGWEQKGNWVIEDGAMYRKDSGGPVTCTVKPVPDDFELRFDWKVSKGCNSGVYYRPAQYEYQVLDNANSPYGENPRQSAASLFFCIAPSKDASKPLGEWNEGRVMCKRTVIQHWLNGEKVIDFDYTDPKWAKEVELLRIRGADLNARGGKLWLQDHGQPVWFRSIRLREIPPGEELTRSEFTPMPVPPAALEKENERVRKMLDAKKKTENLQKTMPGS